VADDDDVDVKLLLTAMVCQSRFGAIAMMVMMMMGIWISCVDGTYEHTPCWRLKDRLIGCVFMCV
jgi:hypothetical protein